MWSKINLYFSGQNKCYGQNSDLRNYFFVKDDKFSFIFHISFEVLSSLQKLIIIKCIFFVLAPIVIKHKPGIDTVKVTAYYLPRLLSEFCLQKEMTWVDLFAGIWIVDLSDLFQ